MGDVFPSNICRNTLITIETTRHLANRPLSNSQKNVLPLQERKRLITRHSDNTSNQSVITDGEALHISHLKVTTNVNQSHRPIAFCNVTRGIQKLMQLEDFLGIS